MEEKGDTDEEDVNVGGLDDVGVALPALCDFCAGLALACAVGRATFMPLAAKLFGTVALTLASSTQLAAEERRNSVKAKE